MEEGWSIVFKKNEAKEKHKLLLNPVFSKKNHHAVNNTDQKKQGISPNKSAAVAVEHSSSSRALDRRNGADQKQSSSTKAKPIAAFDATSTNFPSLASAMESKRFVPTTASITVQSGPDINSIRNNNNVITKIRNSVIGLLPVPPPAGKKTKKITLFDMILIGNSDKESKNVFTTKSREPPKPQSVPTADDTEVSHIVPSKKKEKKKKRLSSLKKKLIQVR